MWNLKWFRRFIVSFTIVSVLAVAAGFWFATSIEAYDVAKRVIDRDPTIEEAIPAPRTYRLAFLDGFQYSTVGTSAKARYRFVVSNESTDGVVDMTLARETGRWRLIDGTVSAGSSGPFSLTPRPMD
jgi:hypothetical protein